MDIINRRKLRVVNGYVLDPFSINERWIYRRASGKYFLRKYGLQLNQVWNLANGYPIFYHPECPTCGAPLLFRSLQGGWNSFCSTSCAAKHQMSLDKYKSIINKSLNSVDSQSRGRFTQFLNSGNPFDLCYIYIAKFKNNNLFKFGITKNPNQRIGMYGIALTNMRLIRSGSRILVGCIERDLKVALNQIEEEIHEDELKFVEDFITDYIIDPKEYWSRGYLQLDYS